ncbi:multidrug resistance-associated protein 1-like [Pomacea canaliculata]|uniref:multidrug resistance-associated protein 1-like n=1 Tax=Pomacea canaliculata TaxID=400727 RepID=UPI000D73AECD|nr:multidrug resistance-associated protein 1-like [Pomacea canaliculata]XP_025101782.1 multidrug resistance-associated protein 1-like [Pomacea canaliculata]
MAYRPCQHSLSLHSSPKGETPVKQEKYSENLRVSGAEPAVHAGGLCGQTRVSGWYPHLHRSLRQLRGQGCDLCASCSTHSARRVSGVTSSCVLFIFWFLTLCAHVIPLYTLFIQEVADNSFILFAIFIFSFTFIAIQFFFHCVSESRGDHSHSSTQSGQRPENPEHNASFPSKVTFHWVTSLIRKGYKSTLFPKDVWDLPPGFKTSAIFPEFIRRWTTEVAKVRKPW